MCRHRSRWRWLVWVLGWCIFMPAAAQTKEELYQKVFGKKVETERSIEVELEVDGYGRDPVPVRIIGKRLLDVDLPILTERLADLLDDATAACLQSAAADHRVEAALSCGRDHPQLRPGGTETQRDGARQPSA